MNPNWPPEFDALPKITDPFERRLYFTAILAKYAAQRDGSFVIVGGNAAAYYTKGQYATADADLLTPDKQPLAFLLTQWGFRLEGRVYWHPELELVVDLISARLPGDPGRVAELDIRGLTVRILPVEELIIDRLNAAVHWQSADDLFWAKAMCRANASDIDWGYLMKRAAEERTTEALAVLKQECDSHAPQT